MFIAVSIGSNNGSLSKRGRRSYHLNREAANLKAADRHLDRAAKHGMKAAKLDEELYEQYLVWAEKNMLDVPEEKREQVQTDIAAMRAVDQQRNAITRAGNGQSRTAPAKRKTTTSRAKPATAKPATPKGKEKYDPATGKVAA